MKAHVRIALGVAALRFFTACAQDTVDSNQIAPANGGGTATNNIDRSYDLVAREGSSDVSFLATFRMSGTWNTTVRLSAPSQLVFDGKKLDDSQLVSKETAVFIGGLLPVFSPFLYLASGTHYHARTTAGNHEIQWTDQTGRAFIDQMSVVPCVLVQAPTVISKSRPGSTWIANPQAGVNMNFSGSLEQRRSDRSLAYASGRSSNGQIAFTDLNAFEAGPATVKIECETRFTLNGSGGGRATGTSRYVVERAVTVVP